MRSKRAMSTLEEPQVPPTDMYTNTYVASTWWERERERERELPAIPISPVPSFTEFQSTHIPTWTRELNARSATRPSRASSIISTQTRFSNTTIGEDARSIDIQVGGQSFRISRDGSTVKNEAPPPYSASETSIISPLVEEARHHSETSSRQDPTGTIEGRFPSNGEDLRASGTRSAVRISTSNRLGANILDPSEVDLPSPVDNDQGDNEATPPSTPRAGHQFLNGPGPQDVRLSRENLQRSDTVRRITHAQPAQQHKPSLRIRPAGPDVLSESSKSRSADPVLPGMSKLTQTPSSPAYIGRKATGVFPFPDTPPMDTFQGASRNSINASESMRGFDVDTENEISLHYARMIRFIDRDHRRVIHEKDKELADLRELLHEKDTVYRQELKAKDFRIDDLKRRLDHLEDSIENKLEHARHEVEDLWEGRWKTQSMHLKERMKAIESRTRLDLVESRGSFDSQDRYEDEDEDKARSS